MKATEELWAELLQLWQEYQKNMASMIEHLEWLRKMGKRSTSKKVNNSPHEGGLTDPHVDVMEVPTPNLNEGVSIGEGQAVIYIEIVDTSLGAEIVTSTEEEGATFGPIDDDYEGDDTTTSSATLALAVEPRTLAPMMVRMAHVLGLLVRMELS
jgi:hypothetical protein